MNYSMNENTFERRKKKILGHVRGKLQVEFTIERKNQSGENCNVFQRGSMAYQLVFGVFSGTEGGEEFIFQLKSSSITPAAHD